MYYLTTRNFLSFSLLFIHFILREGRIADVHLADSRFRREGGATVLPGDQNGVFSAF